MRMGVFDSDDSGDDSDYSISDGALEALSSDSDSSSAEEDTVVRRNCASATRYKLIFLEASLGLQIRQNLTQGGVYVVSTDGNRGDRDDATRSKIIVGDLMVKVGRTPVAPTATVDTCVSILQRNSQRPITITFQRGQSRFSSDSKRGKDSIKKTSKRKVTSKRKANRRAYSTNRSKVKRKKIKVQKKQNVEKKTYNKRGKAHPTIVFKTAAPCASPNNFASKAYGSKVAKSNGRDWVVRLAGSLTMQFKTTCHFSRVNDDALYHLRCERSDGAWDEYGEPERGFITVHRLYDLCNCGKLKFVDDFGPTLLWSLTNLITPDPKVYNAPLIRVLVDYANNADYNGNIKGTGKLLRFKLDVYFTRLIFYLIAFDPVRYVMDALTQGVKIVSSVHPLPTYPSVFTTKRQRENPVPFSYTLPGLLKDQEHPGYREALQPPGVALSLKAYQRQTLAWMEDQESLRNGLNSLFWEKREWLDCNSDTDYFYYMPSAGELRLEEPGMVRGGLLCEEMGLGKTLEIVCCILNDKQKNISKGLEKAESGWNETHYRTRATLIVAPVTLISQWVREVKKSLIDKDTLSVYVHDTKLHGKCKFRPESEPDCEGSKCALGRAGHYYQRLEHFAGSSDIVITSYKMLKTDKTFFQSVHWRRIVLDEMQEIRSSTTDLARTWKRLASDFRWMVSGTPLYSDLNDLNGELNFLGIIPFSLDDKWDGFWGLRVSRPFKEKNKEALDLLNVLLDGIMMRHSKSQKFAESGRSILDLPGRTVTLVGIDFDKTLHEYNSIIADGTQYTQSIANQYIVKALERIAIDFFETFNGLSEASRRARVNIIVNLLRRSCTSVSLINGGAGCTQMLSQIDRILRDRFGVEHAFENENDAGVAQVVATASDITVVSPQYAMDILMRSRAIAQTRTDVQTGMVRQGNTHQGVYERRRVYAMKTILEKACEAIEKCAKFKVQVKQKHWLNRSRWKLAVELITNGYYFYAMDKTKQLSREASLGSTQSKYVPACKTIRDRVKQWEKAAIEGNIESTHIPGWRHRQGDKVWHGREYASELVETEQEATENAIKQMFMRLSSAKMDNRPQKIIMQYQLELNNMVISYSNNIRDDTYEKTRALEKENDKSIRGERKVRIARTKTAFYEMIAQSKTEEANSLNNNTDHNVSRSHLVLGPIPSFFPFQNYLFHRAKANAPVRKNYAAQLRQLISRLKADVPRAQNQYDKVKPYLSKMLWAVREGHGSASERSVEQNGFSSLQQIMEGKVPSCSICYQPVVRPTFTRCVHLGCAECICSWLQAAPMLDIDAAQRARSRQMAMLRNAVNVEREKHAPCMLCRQPFSASQLVCVDVNLGTSLSPKTNDGATNTPKQATRPVIERANDLPIFTPAFTSDELDGLGTKLLNRQGMEARIGRYPALSQAFVTALYGATGVVPGAKSNLSNSEFRSPKIRKMLEITLGAIRNEEKIVIFSQHVDSIKHVSVILTEDSLPHTKIVRGDDVAYQSTALHTFTTQPSCNVLLLHSGAAAAGLTLTCAQNVILLEPFVSSGDENQAFARCHRMGQRNDVKCFILYMKDSIEERMLAYRTKESQFAKRGADVATTRSSSMSSSAQAGNSSDFICQRDESDLSVLSDLKKERINDAKLFFLCGLREEERG